MELEYRDIPGFLGYRVGNDGSVWSCKRTKEWKQLKATRRDNGYYVISIFLDGKQKQMKVHAIVLCAFRGDRPKGSVARHLNGNQEDNRLVNLAWGTPLENMLDKHTHGTMYHPIGTRNSHAYLDEYLVRKIRNLASDGMRTRAIASLLGVGRGAVCGVVSGRNWRHVL